MIKKLKSVVKVTIVILTIGTMINHKIEDRNVLLSQYKSNKVIHYTVKTGDCISVIAYKYKGSRNMQNVISEIKYLNNISDDISVGRDLIIPLES